MNKQLLEENKAKLLAEQKKLKQLLGHESTADSEFPGGYKPKFDEAGSEQTENASEIEQFGNDLAVTEDLSGRLHQVSAALARIENGSYGKCMVGGDEIGEDRLRAEPAAETCINHSN
ncbi:MAG: hypothetical protein A3J07_01215 [Candidatus Doudnabacteria bacterium RIFCSPLOWO2_02_FULL_49_13]|uniref:Zinc finger DksA/TraR C4-type domain-containing protein n=1 Tax=Candidatus Doudnabacteria bacterium RIFCSPHIGHO2_12_FULL_48_16 TaxID=1817838 RepID=A0A1F5PKH0_9BACT|nr:MAG: hypothetical protein A3B77_04145 [Candidatus Doudnabacteria bacterium RIFCSPHIGHO2_02_FULL_49_24]OGE88674.1 MAG: hypothetical protein A2760_01805 [Candidatus Doudnabacteria bacterium RIFCSPHIGHO2_01_FULL_50_67]OGE90359.1 MAG: hypothetical protein A3E29_04725 [Candidatus Doudnabacteria bacterium RIFCSPHIGHO2_12_FULL_48_16]OGE97066.1 MAG: hypothetical protein A2990_01715 [Candidatus Doudnabacteria bacterium RIFCSPLOWO2_01_FULL_49_40]OGF02415.1 MAG: hypothetical protein A3J07_01215 [Candid